MSPPGPTVASPTTSQQTNRRGFIDHHHQGFLKNPPLPDSRNLAIPQSAPFLRSSSTSMAARCVIRCDLRRFPDPAVRTGEQAAPVPKVAKSAKIVLQPRLCTLRSYGSDLVGVVKKKDGSSGDETSPFFGTLSEYIESCKKSEDFETVSGRLAMVVFAATVAREVVTGNSLFGKMEVEGIEKAAGVCLAAVACAAVSAWLSSARTRVGRIFTLRCNALIDSLIDQIVDGLFYETDLTDWSDDI